MNVSIKVDPVLWSRPMDVIRVFTKIDALHNGFRQDVFNAVVKQGNKIKNLQTDVKLIKELVVENKKHYKQIEGAKK